MLSLFEARIEVFPKPGTRVPEAAAILDALKRLGFEDTLNVSVGRVFVVHLRAADRDRACIMATNMAGKLLANPVLERFGIDVIECPQTNVPDDAERMA